MPRKCITCRLHLGLDEMNNVICGIDGARWSKSHSCKHHRYQHEGDNFKGRVFPWDVDINVCKNQKSRMQRM